VQDFQDDYCIETLAVSDNFAEASREEATEFDL
jgi:hypothetical protein